MEYDKNNVFARIIRGEVVSEKIYEDDKVIAIKDIAPLAPTHILVIPKGEYISFDDFAGKASEQEISHFYKIVHSICKKLEINKQGYRVVSNVGEHGMQTVPHMHLHILAGKALGDMVD